MSSPSDLITAHIQKPARYLGNERGAARKDWSSANVRWVLTYPEVYELGASNLGHIILYNILNAQPRQLCDRTYLPGSDLAQILKQKNIPLFALESKRSLLDFDILGFSLSYELGATNILEMLSLAQIPLTWQQRNQGNYPLVFAGGGSATSNPEPYADFFDFFALGDGEELLPEIGLVLEQGKKDQLSKEELLLDLAQVPGVYVPRFYAIGEQGAVLPIRQDVPERILRRVATPIPQYSIGLVPFVETVHDRLTIEIRRGCTRGCRFCQPGMLTRPAHDVEPEKVIETVEKGMRATGYNEFSLLSLSCSDYLSLPAVGTEIRNRLRQENITLTLPSQRVDRFDENIANVIGGSRQGGLTFAPEAGTQRLRDIINKGLTNEELLRGIKTALEQGWDRIKLYFMIGLPGESDQDVLGIAETIDWLKRECRKQGQRRLQFTLTISNFTPKPHTPFQWHSVSTAEFIRKQDLLRQAFKNLRDVKVNYTDVRISAMEEFVGRGDRSLAPVVRRAWELGAGMDSWWENLPQAYGAWQQAIEEAGLSWKYREVLQGQWNMLEKPLPWDHINSGISKQWLKEDLQKALSATTVADCSFDGCSHCGVCGPDFGHNIVIEPPAIPAFAGTFQPNQTRAQRLRVYFGKLGDMSLVSHLDLVRLFDRLMRRAAIPISFTGGFHPGPRISIANALPLGATSNGEIVEFELTEVMEIEEFKRRLSCEIPIYRVEQIPLDHPSAASLLQRAQYILTFDNSKGTTQAQWLEWIGEILNKEEFFREKTTKSGKKATIDLRSLLHSLSLENFQESEVVLSYEGSCCNDGRQLNSAHMVWLLEQVSNQQLELKNIHRQALVLD